MDRIDAPHAAPEDDPEDAPTTAPRPHSQSRLSPTLFWVLLAAVVFRIVTGVMGREPSEDAVGLVRWQPREKAAPLAQASGKPILYDFSAAWCGPCKLLDRDWADPTVAGKVNASFIPTRIIDRLREDGRNPEDIAELQRRFEITGFPAIVAASPDGRLLGKLEGYAGRGRLMRFLEDPARE
jgi:thiol:disulfide interchange protein